MNIEQLRELKKTLMEIKTYYPPAECSAEELILAEGQAEMARERYNQLAPVFALLDEMDLLHVELAKQFRSLDDRLIQLEKYLVEEER